MRITAMKALCAFTAVLAFAASAGIAGDLNKAFADEEIKPYIKIMDGPWLANNVSGSVRNYRVTAKAPRGAKYVVGLFDNKVGRTGADERSAVVLIDGVNPLAPSESLPVADIDKSDVSGMRKAPLDGLTFNSRDTSGKDCCVKVVDAKEEYALGPVQPFAIPAGRTGKNLARIDVFIFAGPAYPPVPGQVVEYGAPLVKYSVFLEE